MQTFDLLLLMLDLLLGMLEALQLIIQNFLEESKHKRGRDVTIVIGAHSQVDNFATNVKVLFAMIIQQWFALAVGLQKSMVLMEISLYVYNMCCHCSYLHCL